MNDISRTIPLPYSGPPYNLRKMRMGRSPVEHDCFITESSITPCDVPLNLRPPYKPQHIPAQHIHADQGPGNRTIFRHNTHLTCSISSTQTRNAKYRNIAPMSNPCSNHNFIKLFAKNGDNGPMPHPCPNHKPIYPARQNAPVQPREAALRSFDTSNVRVLI